MKDDDDIELEDAESDVDAQPAAITLLTDEHDEVRQLFQDYASLVGLDADASERRSLIDALCLRLTVHAAIEEEIFYPAARDALDDPALINEAIGEHDRMKELIAELRDMQPNDARCDALVELLQATVEEHVDEEEGEIFPLTTDSSMDLEALGEEMEVRRQELLAELGAE